MTGDGTGGTEKYLADTSSSKECTKLVRSSEPSANGVTWGRNTWGNWIVGKTEECWAEFEATGNDDSKSHFETCIL